MVNRQFKRLFYRFRHSNSTIMNTYTLQQIINGYRAIQDLNNSPVIVPGVLLFEIEDIKTILEPKCINFDKSKKSILESDSEKKNDEIFFENFSFKTCEIPFPKKH